jgi:hypothetical protein
VVEGSGGIKDLGHWWVGAETMSDGLARAEGLLMHLQIQRIDTEVSGCKKSIEFLSVNPKISKSRSDVQQLGSWILQVQRIDAEDPWLQSEWGEVMLAGRRQEGFVHLQVSPAFAPPLGLINNHNYIEDTCLLSRILCVP